MPLENALFTHNTSNEDLLLVPIISQRRTFTLSTQLKNWEKLNLVESRFASTFDSILSSHLAQSQQENIGHFIDW
jgi:hypothetical protein